MDYEYTPSDMLWARCLGESWHGGFTYSPSAGLQPDAQTSQDEIDSAVKDALGAPKREAEELRKAKEIQRRVTAAEAIGAEDDQEPGAILRWRRKYGKSYYVYAAIKADNGKWFVTGSTMVKKTSGWSWDSDEPGIAPEACLWSVLLPLLSLQRPLRLRED